MLDRSPALIPKPIDWASHISISGFYVSSSKTCVYVTDCRECHEKSETVYDVS